MPNDPTAGGVSPEQLTQLVYGLYRDEFDREMGVEERNNFGGSAAQNVEHVVNRLTVRHAHDLMHMMQVGTGQAVNTAELAPAYLEQLRTVGATDETLVEAATRLYPNLTRAAAVRKWQQAAKGVSYDVRSGDDNPATFYDPARGSKPRDSNG